MGIPEAAKLSESIRRNAEGFKKLCEGLDEETASRATGDRWSPKQIISHVSGPEGVGFTPTITAILEQDTPLLELDPGNPFFSEKRARMTVAELLAEFVREYRPHRRTRGRFVSRAAKTQRAHSRASRFSTG